ncbi:hypothetical protein F5Y18DRAFT_193579 [Xylariaceae sp. FL1019]|nr:hypothetical protein F5Y18DRAFT_193579 [Xylariaceae sp. FL1019]
MRRSTIPIFWAWPSLLAFSWFAWRYIYTTKVDNNLRIAPDSAQPPITSDRSSPALTKTKNSARHPPILGYQRCVKGKRQGFYFPLTSRTSQHTRYFRQQTPPFPAVKIPVPAKLPLRRLQHYVPMTWIHLSKRARH